MISYIKRKNLDLIKYNYCIENAVQSRIYAFSWYLDIVADHWDVLVLGDYEAVMPVPWRKKYLIKYVYQPLWVLELGVFSLDKSLDINLFIEVLSKKFKFAELRLNTHNSTEFTQKQFQVLSLNNDYVNLQESYRSDRKKDLRKAEKFFLTESWNEHPTKLIKLFRNNVGKRVDNITEQDYQNLNELMTICIEKGVGDVLSIYDRADFLVASGFFIKHKKTVSILVSSTDFNNRQKGGNTYLIDAAIFKYIKNFDEFNFGGSSIESIANYFLSFGAKTIQYQLLRVNNLPKIFRVFKK